MTVHRLPGTPLTGRLLLVELLEEDDDEMSDVVVVSADKAGVVSVSHSRMSLDRLAFMALALLNRAQELARGGREEDVVTPGNPEGGA